MWGGVPQLVIPYRVRRVQRFPEKYQRPLSDREKEIIEKVKRGVKNDRGLVVPDIKVLDEYGCPPKERNIVMDEVEGRKGDDRRTVRVAPPYDPAEAAKRRPRMSYLDLLRCGGKTTGVKSRKKDKKKTTKYRSYAEARKMREQFRKRLVEVIMHRDEWDDSDEEPAHAGAPLTTKEKDLLRYYYYIHNGIDTRYVAGINQKWFKRIMTMVPKKLQRNQKEIKKIHEDIKEDYLFAVKKSIVDFVLKEPEIDEDERFLDEDDETPMTIELAMVSNAWRKLYKQSRKHLRFNLHTINSCLLGTLSLWYRSYNTLRFLDAEKLKEGPKMEMMAYQDRTYRLVEEVKNRLKDEWLKSIHDIYKGCSKKRQLPAEARTTAFLRCLAVQMTNSVQSLCLESMKDFDGFVRSLNSKTTEDRANQRAGFVMNLKCVSNQILFYPTFEDIRSAILETYDIMIRACNEIPRFEYVLDEPDEDEKPVCLKPTILQELIDGMKTTVADVVEEQRRYPEEYVREYDKFLYLIDGRAEREIEAYVQESHGFEEFSEKVRFFDDLANTLLNSIQREVNLGLFELHCEDLIMNLQRKTMTLREQVLKKMSNDHQEENKRLCAEYEDISNTALSSPSNTEELVKLKEKVQHTRTVTMAEKEKELTQAARRLVFLSDYLQFTTAEMKLNTKTFQWHAKMPKVFEEHEAIVSEKTAEYQKALKLRRERFIEELENSNAQVDDFYSYGNVDELPKYMKKAQTLSTKLTLCKEKIQQFNMEEDAFEWEQTNYPLWQATVDKLNPFLGLYETSMAFVNKQKTWFESPMGTHDPQDIEAEVNRSWELVSRLESEFSDIPAARELVVNVREKIEDFRSKMPVIRTLGNPGFRDRHWENVSNTVGFPVKGGSNLFQILDMGLDGPDWR